MPRIEAVSSSEAGLLAKIAYFFSRRKLGIVPGPVKLAAHSTSVLIAYGAFELGLERASRVERRLLTLASLRVASLVGCPF